jgi:hypothetical protein
MKAKVIIRKTNRELITNENVVIVTDEDHAKHILDTAIALAGVELEDIKVAEYTIDGKLVYGYLRQSDGLGIIRPE